MNNDSILSKSNDIVMVDGLSYNVRDLNLDPKYIQFTIDGSTILNVVNTFKNTTSITLLKEGSEEPYGIYENILFSSALVSSEGSITVTFSITSDIDMRLKKLEEYQVDTDMILSDILYGGDEN